MRYFWDFVLAYTEVVQICTNARGIVFFPHHKDRVKLKKYNFSTSIFYKYAASSSIFIHETVEANDEEDKVYVMVAVRADKELAAGTVVSIGFSVQFAGEEKGSKVSK